MFDKYCIYLRGVEKERRIMICSLPLCGCQAEKQPAQAGDKGDQLRCIGNTSHSYPGMNNEASAYFIRLFSSSENTKIIKYFVQGEARGQTDWKSGVWYRHWLSILVIGGNWWDQATQFDPETPATKNLIAKTGMYFLLDIFSAFVLCWMWVWLVTSSGRCRVWWQMLWVMRGHLADNGRIITHCFISHHPQ